MNCDQYSVPMLLEDPYNYRNSRNINNTPLNNFNCGGFALETFTWYEPSKVGDSSSLISLEENIAVMLSEFIDMRVIKKMEDAKEDENIIAFRKSSGDFHYMKYNRKTNVWDHKLGYREEILHQTTKEVFNDSWINKYDGAIVLLAKKKICI